MHLLFDHSLIVVSFEPDKKSPFGRSNKHCTGPSCPCKVSMHLPSFQIQMLLHRDNSFHHLPAQEMAKSCMVILLLYSMGDNCAESFVHSMTAYRHPSWVRHRPTNYKS